MKRIGLMTLCVLFCVMLFAACGQAPEVSDSSVPQDTTTTTTVTTASTTTTEKAVVSANAGSTPTDEASTTISSVSITTNLVTRPSTEAGESTRQSTTAKSAYSPPHLSQDATDDTTTTVGTTGTTVDYTLPTVFDEQNRHPEVVVWTDKEVYGSTDKVTIYVHNLSDENLLVGNEFWLWEQVEGGWQTVHDKNGMKMALYAIYPQTPSSAPLSIGMKLTDYDLKPNTRYMAGYPAGGGWIGAEFTTAEE